MTLATISALFWFALDYMISPQFVKTSLRNIFRIRKSDGFYVHGMIHHTIISIGSFVVYLRENDPNIVGEPDRSFLCLPPVTSLSEILPAISLGYGFHDVVDGFRRSSPTFVAHGALLVFGFTLLCSLGVAHHLVRVLMINVSSIFLNMRRLDGGVGFNFAVDMMFVVSFIIMRIIILPSWWIQFLYRAYSSDPQNWGDCMNEHVVLFAFFGGCVLHGLNLYWMYLILRNVCRRYRTSSLKRKSLGITGSSK